MIQNDDKVIIDGNQINGELVNNVNNNETVDTITADKPKRGRGAIKGQMSEKTKEALAKGREKLKMKWDEDKKAKEELMQKYAVKKANKMLKEKLAIKKQMGIEDLDSDDEEPIKLIKPVKPKKKKQIIVLPEESESEEEEIVYKTSKPKKSNKQQVQEQPIQQPQQPQKIMPKIIFF